MILRSAMFYNIKRRRKSIGYLLGDFWIFCFWKEFTLYFPFTVVTECSESVEHVDELSSIIVELFFSPFCTAKISVTRLLLASVGGLASEVSVSQLTALESLSSESGWSSSGTQSIESEISETSSTRSGSPTSSSDESWFLLTSLISSSASSSTTIPCFSSFPLSFPFRLLFLLCFPWSVGKE